ncbi:MocR-like pyridoxine biosynthesis transcription factor PdxR [Arcticibacterium luteifluviistationis]|uniref:GntR family transcriptional regulator n=1 Tax=Arcticibacterium luteifluviistationis TaxID=1784714 RepID=A0A2Z4GHN3_9BACT|nr:PLP-dependent aminotransferase family protein [Arcticibacterium luteifluviistationis]AWW00851.1 GntR family transcriptional regulator [Arcticibacterium luteifluviistationis]
MVELINIDKENEKPVFRQIADQLIENIQAGTIRAGAKLPGSRKLAELWGVHRKTVLAAMDELINQGWLETKPGSGTFIAMKIEAESITELQVSEENKGKAAKVEVPQILKRDLHLTKEKYHLDDGLPDPRLAPVSELSRAYKTALTAGNLYPKYTYADTKGHLYLREVLADYLLKTRALDVSPEQIMITRGVTQAVYLAIQTFVSKGDTVAMPELNWSSAEINFKYHGANVVNVRVDKEGLDVEHLEDLCQEHKFKMLYVTPHHQYPTTVIMPAYRRVKLVQLARKYGFYIFEDDYDYDFHYTSHPIMPLASTRHGDFVLYTGSFTKSISPVFRLGYLVAHKDQIDLMARIRRLIDRQGDSLLELAVAELLKLGTVQRYLRKNKKIYEQRRDYFSELLTEQLDSYLNFEKPMGGMSIWTKFNDDINLIKLAERALKKDLYFSDGNQHCGSYPGLNSTRLGFASSTEEELETAVKILKSLL